MKYKAIVRKDDGECLSLVKFDSLEGLNEYISNIRESSEQMLIRLNGTYLKLTVYKLQDDEWKEDM
jgi:hypothetical protein